MFVLAEAAEAAAPEAELETPPEVVELEPPEVDNADNEEESAASGFRTLLSNSRLSLILRSPAKRNL